MFIFFEKHNVLMSHNILHIYLKLEFNFNTIFQYEVGNRLICILYIIILQFWLRI